MDTRDDLDEAPVERSGWARLGHLLVQLSIVIGTAIALIDGELSAPEKGLAAALAAVLLVWHGSMAYRARGPRPGRRGPDEPRDRTGATHRVPIYRKLDVDDRTHAVTTALKKGLMRLGAAAEREAH